MSNTYIKQDENGLTEATILQRSAHANVWFLMLVISLLFSFSAGLFLIWMSIDRTDLGYDIHKIQKTLDSGQGHIVKLEVERDSLLSPYELDKKAQALGLSIADPGQVRRLIN